MSLFSLCKFHPIPKTAVMYSTLDQIDDYGNYWPASISSKFVLQGGPMNLTQVKSAIKFMVKTELEHKLQGMPKLTLVGDTGVGKTAITRQSFQELVDEGVFNKDKAVFIEKHLAQMEVGDLIGLPDTSGEKTVWRAPCWWPEADQEGILFLEEFGDVKNDVQRAVQQLILEKQLYTHKLPAKMSIVLAMNPIDPEFGSYDFSRQLKNRLAMLRVAPNVTEWAEFASKNEQLKTIVSLIKSDTSLLYEEVMFEVPDGVRTPRSVTQAGILSSYMTKDDAKSFGFQLLTSICGKAVASMLASAIAEENPDVGMQPVDIERLMTGTLDSRLLAVTDLKNLAVCNRLDLVDRTMNNLKSFFKDASKIFSRMLSDLGSSPQMKEHENVLTRILSVIPVAMANHFNKHLMGCGLEKLVFRIAGPRAASGGLVSVAIPKPPPNPWATTVPSKHAAISAMSQSMSANAMSQATLAAQLAAQIQPAQQQGALHHVILQELSRGDSTFWADRAVAVDDAAIFASCQTEKPKLITDDTETDGLDNVMEAEYVRPDEA